MDRPQRDDLLMRTARIWSERSTCSRAHVGCVISRDGRILVQGYNGAPAGIDHCDHTCNCSIGQSSPKHDTNCPAGQYCTISVHAEANAIAFAARHGVALQDTELHTTRIPCTTCAMLIINAGIGRVIYRENHRDMGGLTLFRQVLMRVAKDDKVSP